MDDFLIFEDFVAKWKTCLGCYGKTSCRSSASCWPKQLRLNIVVVEWSVQRCLADGNAALEGWIYAINCLESAWSARDEAAHFVRWEASCWQGFYQLQVVLNQWLSSRNDHQSFVISFISFSNNHDTLWLNTTNGSSFMIANHSSIVASVTTTIFHEVIIIVN